MLTEAPVRQATPGAVRSRGYGKRIVTGVTVTVSDRMASLHRAFLCFPCSPVTTPAPDLSTVSMVLPLLEHHSAGTVQHVAFQVGLSHRVLALKAPPCFSGVGSSFSECRIVLRCLDRPQMMVEGLLPSYVDCE